MANETRRYRPNLLLPEMLNCVPARLDPETKVRTGRHHPAHGARPQLWTQRLLSRPLKLVTQRELHDARRARGASDLPELRQRDVSVRQGEDIVIERIVGFPPKDQLMPLGPRHGESLQERRIHVPETRPAKNVPIARLPVAWITQGGERRLGIAEELDGGIAVMNLFPQRIGCPIVQGRRAVHGQTYWERVGIRAERQSTSGADDTADFPSADDGVQPTGRIPAEPASATERKLIDTVRIDKMPDVEVGAATTHTEVASVANQTAKHCVRDARLIINRTRDSVVEVELEAS